MGTSWFNPAYAAGALWAAGTGALVLVAFVAHRNGDGRTAQTSAFGAVLYAAASAALLVAGVVDGYPGPVALLVVPVAAVAAFFAGDFAAREFRALEPAESRSLTAGAAAVAAGGAALFFAAVAHLHSVGG